MNHHSRKSLFGFAITVAFVAVWAAWSVLPVQAQSFYGSIFVIVADSSGAVIPDAALTLTNIGTNEKRTAQSDATGGYRFVNLVPASYRLEVEMTGFKRLLREPIAVQVESAIRIDAVLEVGNKSETLEVSAETPLLQTETASLSQVIEGRHVLEMPLNGRNAMNLIALVPGVVPQGSTSGSTQGSQGGTASGAHTNNAAWNNYQIGGTIANQSASYLDGAPLNVNGMGNTTALVATQDAVQEFRVVTNNVSAEFGRFAGGVVNMTTKSGNNSFHGTAYEYFRNTIFNANYFFSNKTGQARPNWLQNQYGATLGGPIKKDKTFFFFSWEGYTSRIGVPPINTVPMPAWRAGDFSSLLGAATTTINPCTGLARRSGEIYDPLTTRTVSGQVCRDPFAGNIIPSNRIDATSNYIANTLKYFPLPNLPGTTNNFVTTAHTGGDQNQYNARIDQSFGDNQRLFGRYTYWTLGDISFNPLGNMTGNPPSNNRTHQVVIGDALTLNPTNILDLRLSYLRQYFDDATVNKGTDMSQFGTAWAAINNQVTYGFLPRMVIAGYYNFRPMTIFSERYFNAGAFSANLTRIQGRHTFKIGGELRLMTNDTVNATNGGGNFNFDTGMTSVSGATAATFGGNAFASFMLGSAANGSTIQTVRPISQYSWYQGYYFNDVFQAGRRLTINYGVRWELPGAYAEKHDRADVLLVDAPDALGLTLNGQALKGQVALVNSSLYSDRTILKVKHNLFSPRIGIAYRITDQTVLRAGYGINYMASDIGGVPPNGMFINQANTTMLSSVNNAGLVPLNLLSNPFPSGIIQPYQRSDTYSATLDGAGVITSNTPDQPYPYVQQWNLNIERQLKGGLLIEVGYAGSKGTHLALAPINLNQLSSQYYSLGSALTTAVTNPFFGKLSASSPYGKATIAAGQLLRPYPQFGNLFNGASATGMGGPHAGDSNYHSLQMKGEKKFGSGGVLMVNYTWSKMISTADTLFNNLESNTAGTSIQDNNTIRNSRSLSSYDAPHRFMVSYVLDLPIGKGKKYLSGLSGITDKLVSGWGVNGITTFQSGFPLVFSAQATTISSTFGGGTPLPNVVAGCMSIYGGKPTDRLSQWFNTACFSQPGAFSFGNEPRVDPKLRAQGFNNWDFAFFKNTSIKEGVNLQFRAEGFNLFNRTQFAPPSTSFGTASFGTVSSQFNQPRLLQFALRITF
jgi:hypothetical protein